MTATRSLIAVVVALAVAPACGGGGGGDGDIIIVDPVDDTIAEGEARGSLLADEAFADLSGDEYLVQIGKTASILAAVNDGELDQATFAVQVVDAPDVFDFANNLIIDHDDANIRLDGVVRFYGVGYLPSSAADAVILEANAGLGELRATPPIDIDFAFVELQVIMHAQALVLLDELFAIVGPGDMGDYIIDTQDMIDLHLSEAEALLATFY